MQILWSGLSHALIPNHCPHFPHHTFWKMVQRAEQQRNQKPSTLKVLSKSTFKEYFWKKRDLVSGFMVKLKSDQSLFQDSWSNTCDTRHWYPLFWSPPKAECMVQRKHWAIRFRVNKLPGPLGDALIVLGERLGCVSAAAGRCFLQSWPLTRVWSFFVYLRCQTGAGTVQGSVLARRRGFRNGAGTGSGTKPKGRGPTPLSGRATPVGPRCAYTLVRLESN